MKVALVSLGCARTLVDSEVALGSLVAHGYSIVKDVKNADIAIVNTCGFIEEAKIESIETILGLCELKKKGKLEAVVVLGCLAQRYGPDLQKQIKEVDAIIGTNNFGDLAKVLEPIQKRKKVYRVEPRPYYLLDEKTPRYSLTPKYTSYVKISEGCLNACSYCVIPKMKGPHRSRSIDSIVREIQDLTQTRQVSEVNLIGQDTAAFGYDADRVFRLPELLEKLARETEVPWLRLLYAHPAHVSQELIDVIAQYSTICKYLDFPIEHSHDDMLLRMNRAVTRQKMEWGLKTMRKKIPHVGIRTTVIVGFPGETEEEFDDLLAFLKEYRFDRLGTFMFSPEEGAKAYDMPGQVPQALKQERYNRVMALQKDISAEINEAWMGQSVRVLIDEAQKEEPGTYIGRTERDAPDVDGQVVVHSAKKLSPGDFVDVHITDSLEYDLVGEVR